MSDTSELSSPLLAPAHACTDLHSKLVHLNIGETILCRALRNSPESVCNVCVRCLFKSWSLILSLTSLLNLFFFHILGIYSTVRLYISRTVSSLSRFRSLFWVSQSYAQIFYIVNKSSMCHFSIKAWDK